MENFGNLLVKISIQVINQLIMTLNSIDKNEIKLKDQNLFNDTIEFESNLLKHSRNISSFIDNQFNLLLTSNQNLDNLENLDTISSLTFDKQSSFNESSCSISKLSTTNQLNQLLDNELSSDDLDNWSFINKTVFRKLKELIIKNDLERCENILIKIGLPIDKVFYFILIKSFDKLIVDNLLNYFKSKDIFIDLIEQVKFQNELWSLLDFNEFTINFSSLAYGDEDKIKNLIITALLNLNSYQLNDLNKEFNFDQSSQLKSPTIKSPTIKSPTIKSPTIKSPTIKSPTIKSPTIKSADKELNSPTIRSPVLKLTTKNIKDKLLKFVDDKSLFKFLLDCNESDLIIGLSLKDNLKTSINQFNRLVITDEMIDYCLMNSQELSKQYLLYNLTKYKLFLNSSILNKPNQILKRLYSNCINRNAQNFCILCKTGLFSNIKNGNQFQDQLIKYAIEIKQFDFVYWYIKQDNNLKLLKNSKIINNYEKNVLLSLFDYRQDNQSSVKLLNIILQYCKYFNQHLTINNLNDLFENGLIKEAISCMFLAPTSFNDSSLCQSQLWYMKSEIVLECLKQYYPLLYEAFNYSLNDFKQQQLLLTKDKIIETTTDKSIDYNDELIPNLYSLLKGTIIFDVSKLFYWQSTNPYAQINNNQLLQEQRSIPTFSNSSLAEKFGLKANLNYIYYLTRGRPIEAYYQEIVYKNQYDQNTIQKIVYKRVCLLAFYNCKDTSIVSSCIAFLELLELNSVQLTFLISVSKLIMKYAADFLTLTRQDQQEKIGDLLNKACFEENKLAQTNILELIYIAIDRKYDQNDKPIIDELIDYEIAVLFARKYQLDLPTQFLRKCIHNDDWLFLTVYIQLYEYPKEIFEHLLKDKDNNNCLNNSCVAEHLGKAFTSITCLNDSTSIELTSQAIKDQQKQNISRTKTNLYQRIVQRKIKSNKLQLNKQSQQLSSSASKYMPDVNTNSPTDSNTTELDFLNAETLTIASSISELENLQFDHFNSPKNLFNLLMICQKANATEPWRSLLVASCSLRNPVPALIAASIPICDYDYDQHLFECCCCWLFASFKLDDKHLQEIKLNNEPLYVNWTFKDFELLLSYGLRVKDNLIHFNHALLLFIDCNRDSNQNNPLIELVKFLIEFLIEKNYHESLEKLLNFIKRLREYQQSDNSSNPIYNKSNIGRLCYILIDCSLRQTNCLLELHLLLEHFEMSGIENVFNDDILNSKPNLAMLFKLVQCIHQTDCQHLIDMNRMLDLNIRSIDFINYMKEIVEHLQKQNFFKEAKEFAHICELDIEGIILNEFLIKSVSQSENFDFWVDCLRSFINNKISFRTKHIFLCERINSIESRSLKCYLLFNLISDNKQLLYEDYNEKLIELHLEFWNYLIDLECDYQFLSSENMLSYNSIKNHSKLSYGEFKAIEFIWSLLIKYGLKFEDDKSNQNRFIYRLPEDQKCLLNEDKEATVFKLMNNLLNNNCIQLTYLIANLFKLSSLNLEIIQFSNDLANDRIDLKKFNNEIRKLSNNEISLELRMSRSILSDDLNRFNKIDDETLNKSIINQSNNDSNKQLSTNLIKIIERSKESYLNKIKNQDKNENKFELNLHILESLYEHMTYGQKSLKNIILMFKISNHFCIKYYSTNDEEDNFRLLIKLIEKANNSSEYFQLAKELTQLKNITDKRIVNYVCDNLEDYLLNDLDNEYHQSTQLNQINLIQSNQLSPQYYQLHDDNFQLTAATTRKQPAMTKILVIIRLLNDPAILGKRFMNIMNSYKEISQYELSRVIELCIKAHECFKLANDIEGIALVLQRVRILITKNLSLKDDNDSFNSMIRLLIGINRYSEMSYVFDILKENHQLELLLSKKVIKNLQLRIALIDFLKRDRDMYQMIALNFSMHREIAELLENQAKATLRNIKINTSSNLSQNRSILEDIMQELIDASESYTRADCFTRSDSCAKLAELIALQINYLPNLLIVINLSETQANNFINAHTKFFESHIVANAYNLHNWCNALFNNIILNGDWQYYRDYTTYYKLSRVTFEEIMSLYSKFRKDKEKQLSTDKSNTIKQNVQKLVTLINDLKLMYKYSLEFNLITVSASLVDCENIGYIRDLKRQNKI